MGVYQNATSLVKAQQHRFRLMALNQLTAHKELVERGREDHFIFTRGGISSKTLAAMGHPFARDGNAARGIDKNPGRYANSGNAYIQSYSSKGLNKNRKVFQVDRKGRVNPLPINRQSGNLQNSYFRTNYTGKDYVVKMGFRSPHAKYVLSPVGTRYMIYRGFYSRFANSSNVADRGIIAKRHAARSQALVQALRAKNRKP
jgi:ribosomal protein L32E